MINIKIKRLRHTMVIPTRSTNQAAGYDIYACLDSDNIEIKSHETVKINTGFALEIPDGYFAGIFARSGLATKENLRPANCVGVIDSDYRGEYIVPIFNDSDTSRIISNHQRIAQMVIMPYLAVSFNEVEELSSTTRNDKGFGSTGKQ